MLLIGDGIIEKNELRNFYDKFVGVEKAVLDQVTDEGYRVMTAVSTRLLVLV